MWHVSSRSGVTTLRTAIQLLLTYLLTSVELSRQHVATTVTLLLNLASVIVHNNNKLDVGQSPTLAHPAAPLADRVRRHPCTKTNNAWLPWQRPVKDQKSNFRLIIGSHSSTNRGNLAKINPLDYDRNR